MNTVPEKCRTCGHKVPLITLTCNLGLGAVKCIVGILSGSVGLTVDGFHSTADGIGSIFVLGSLKLAEKPRDTSHPYGHGKVEFIVSLSIFLLLICIGVVFFIESTAILINGREKPPHMVAFMIAVLSVIANFIMYNYNRCAGKKLNSPALIANGFENLTDLCSSIPVGLGIVAAQFGYFWCDPLAGVLVAIFIMVNASREFWHNLNHLIDRSAPSSTLRKIRTMAMAVEGVFGAESIRTRQVGQNLWVDLDILVSPGCSVEQASQIADEVRERLLRKAKHVEEVVVYYHARTKVHLAE